MIKVGIKISSIPFNREVKGRQMNSNGLIEDSTLCNNIITATFKLTYPGFALDVNTNLPNNGITVVTGNSGSGKTTFLRCIAGLEHPYGMLTVNNKVWQDNKIFIPTHKRPIGYVFQESHLFPHLSVMGNLNYGKKRAKSQKNKIDYELVVDTLGIAHLLNRDTLNLSGGERQRVAIARALYTSPEVLLFDEPLASLDSDRKDEIIPYILSLKKLNIPIIYVTHSPYEAERLADIELKFSYGQIVDKIIND